MLNQSETILFTFTLALISFGVIGALVLAYQMTMCLYGIFGIKALLCVSGFIIIWVVLYLIFSK